MNKKNRVSIKEIHIFLLVFMDNYFNFSLLFFKNKLLVKKKPEYKKYIYSFSKKLGSTK